MRGNTCAPSRLPVPTVPPDRPTVARGADGGFAAIILPGRSAARLLCRRGRGAARAAVFTFLNINPPSNTPAIDVLAVPLADLQRRPSAGVAPCPRGCDASNTAEVPAKQARRGTACATRRANRSSCLQTVPILGSSLHCRVCIWSGSRALHPWHAPRRCRSSVRLPPRRHFCTWAASSEGKNMLCAFQTKGK